MIAMSYEHLLRRIYQVGRFGKDGVNADEYRKLERAERLLILDKENIRNKVMRLSSKTIEDLEHDYRIQCYKIWEYVSAALKEGLNKYNYKFSETERQELENCIKGSQEISKYSIDTAIKKAEEIFVAHKIFAP